MAFSLLRGIWRNAAVASRKARSLLSSDLLPARCSPVRQAAALTHVPHTRVYVRQLANDCVRSFQEETTLAKGCEPADGRMEPHLRTNVVGEATCSGCGSLLQSDNPNLSGFLPKEKLAGLISTEDSSPSQANDADSREYDKETDKDSHGAVICQRCFSLLHYNTALDITLKADDYREHLSQLRDKRALILLMIDVVDFPGSLFPNLNTLISPNSTVVIVGNKADLLPRTSKPNFLKRFEGFIRAECLKSSLSGCEITGMHFISAKLDLGVEELAHTIAKHWGNRGDIYLLGCTNVGKSTLFNQLLGHLCGASPGELSSERDTLIAPAATISLWPGTTLGLLSFPLMSTGKRLRKASQSRKRQHGHSTTPQMGSVLEEIGFQEAAADFSPEQPAMAAELEGADEDAALREAGLRERKRTNPPANPSQPATTPPQDRFRLYDTPGAINDAQLINLLTTKELKVALPKKAIRPQTFILKPGQCMFIGGLARLDYHEGSVSAYFTVYAASYLPVHTTNISKADDVYSRNLGTPLLKIPAGSDERMAAFPPLKFEPVSIIGRGWKESTADIVLSSAGWVSVTVGAGHNITLLAYTPLGRGIHCRQPALFPEHISERGKRSQKGNRTSFVKSRKKK